jgi:very-short-patch-repair endonuclease
LNYEVDLQVRSVGFKIDLAVKHPTRHGEYILAVECDGASYHRAQWARERDRLRQQVLEDQGWHFHRIWSTDWFHQPEKAKARLAEAIEAARLRAN